MTGFDEPLREPRICHHLCQCGCERTLITRLDQQCIDVVRRDVLVAVDITRHHGRPRRHGLEENHSE